MFLKLQTGVECMRNIYHIKTPENVTLEFELAGVGSRGVAVLIDTLIQNVFLFVVALIVVLITGTDISYSWYEKGNTVYIVIGILLIFITQFGYFLLFELFTKGSTIGKKLVGLKVIMANGEPVSFTASLVRNLLRLGDMLPGIYGVGIFSVVLSERYTRLGDLAANTVVVKVKKRTADFSSVKAVNSERRNIDITPKEEALLTEYMERLKQDKPIYSTDLENQLYLHFYKKIGVIPNLPERFSRKTYLKCLFDYISGT